MEDYLECLTGKNRSHPLIYLN